MPGYRGTARLLIAATGLVMAVAASAQQSAPGPGHPTAPSSGQQLAFDRAKGNCLACHTMKGGDVPSNVGPELVDMKSRYPNARDLAAIIYDEETRNPQTVMPAFGKNLILSKDEINRIIEFLYTL